jgi:hypothetical protein
VQHLSLSDVCHHQTSLIADTVLEANAWLIHRKRMQAMVEREADCQRWRTVQVDG